VEEARVHLRDGSEVLIRQVVPEDRELFVEGFEHFGMESRQSRFLGVKKSLTERELDFLTRVDHERHEAIGAIDVATGEGVGVARMVRPEDGDQTCAEAAVAVVDPWQGRGLGALLLERLVERAGELGVTHFSASLRTDNRAMLALFKQIGAVSLVERQGEVSTIDVQLPVESEDNALGEALRCAAAGDVEHAAAR